MKKQVLIVADDFKLSQSIQTQMDSNTMTTSSVASISEALCCVMKQEYDLVILDLQLPGIDELEMVRIIRIARSMTHVNTRPLRLVPQPSSTRTTVKCWLMVVRWD